MKRYEVIRPPVYLDVFEVTKVGEIRADMLLLEDLVYREVTIEHKDKVTMVELKSNPIKVGDHVRYDVRFDEYTRFDETDVSEGVQLKQVGIH